MELINAFLFASMISYFLCLILPKSTTRNINILLDKITSLISGCLLLCGLFFNINWLWMVLGVIWVVYAGCTFLGYAEINVLWKNEVSDEAQMLMFTWNLLIAIACFTKF